MTSKEKKTVGLVAGGLTAAFLLYHVWTTTALKSKLKDGMAKCRRASHDLLKAEGKNDIDAINQATEYCGEGGELYTESP